MLFNYHITSVVLRKVFVYCSFQLTQNLKIYYNVLDASLGYSIFLCAAGVLNLGYTRIEQVWTHESVWWCEGYKNDNLLMHDDCLCRTCSNCHLSVVQYCTIVYSFQKRKWTILLIYLLQTAES